VSEYKGVFAKQLERVPVDTLFKAACMKHNSDKFIEKLVDKLMLDELLCGECNSVEFFKQCVEDVLKEGSIKFYEDRLNTLRKDNE